MAPLIGSGQWIAVFYTGHGGQRPIEAAGTAQAATPWAAVPTGSTGGAMAISPPDSI